MMLRVLIVGGCDGDCGWFCFAPIFAWFGFSALSVFVACL